MPLTHTLGDSSIVDVGCQCRKRRRQNFLRYLLEVAGRRIVQGEKSFRFGAKGRIPVAEGVEKLFTPITVDSLGPLEDIAEPFPL